MFSGSDRTRCAPDEASRATPRDGGRGDDHRSSRGCPDNRLVARVARESRCRGGACARAACAVFGRRLARGLQACGCSRAPQRGQAGRLAKCAGAVSPRPGLTAGVLVRLNRTRVFAGLGKHPPTRQAKTWWQSPQRSQGRANRLAGLARWSRDVAVGACARSRLHRNQVAGSRAARLRMFSRASGGLSFPRHIFAGYPGRCRHDDAAC